MMLYNRLDSACTWPPSLTYASRDSKEPIWRRFLCIGILLVALAPAHGAWSSENLRFVTLEFAPFIYGENQEVAGPGRDLIAAVCVHARITCSYDIYPWRRAQELIRNGDADGMMVIGRNSRREEWIRFSPPHFRTEYGFFVNATETMVYTDVSQLQGLKIGVFAPSNTATQLSKIRDSMVDAGLVPLEIEERPDDPSGFRKLAAGRIGAVYSNRDRGHKIIDDEGLSQAVRYAGGHQGILYYAGISRNFPDQALVDRFESAWRDLFRRGDAQKIIESYGLEAATVD
jgi:polar amino acid transport system substrate-binding protein